MGIGLDLRRRVATKMIDDNDAGMMVTDSIAAAQGSGATARPDTDPVKITKQARTTDATDIGLHRPTPGTAHM